MNNEEKINNSRQNAGEQKEAQKLTIPVLEEKLVVEKKIIETGKVNITKKVHETVESIEIPVTNEQVNVDRVEINQYVDAAPPAIRQEGDKTIIPIVKEVLVVEKKLLLVEEVHISRKQVKTTTTHQEKLRKEEIIVSRTDNEKPI